MSAFSRFHNSERGSAMTEFVIGLPVYILIFVGMGAIHQLHAAGIKAKLQVNQVMWAEASPGAPGAIGMVPVLGVGGISDWGDLATDGAGLLGIYADSYVKTLIPLSAIGAIGDTRPASACFTLGCGQIDLASNYFARPLLDDNAVSGATSGVSFSGWANGISSVLDITGSRPAVAAGIRYGSVESPSVADTVTMPWGQEYSFETGELGMPGITQPTQRIFAVALTRLEFGTKDIWHEQIPEFNDSWTFDTGDAPEQSGDCSSSVEALEGCQADPPLDADGNPDLDACQEAFDGGACAGANDVPGLGKVTGDWCAPGIPGC